MVNAFFNHNLYLARNPDLVAAGLHTAEQLWDHYVNYGAQESIDDEDRAPNSWFNVEYYLGNYPDLVAAGITANQALNHYYEYGINEGRSFNPTVLPSQFDAEQYAADNKDVREAFGIAEDAELTAQDEANLLKHYLSYGYAEGREGAGEAFENEVNALNDILDIDFKSTEILGTIGNDLFVIDELLTKDKVVIDGLGGTDTVEFVEADNNKSDANAVTLRNIEKVVVEDVTVNANVTSKLDSVKLEGTANATLNFTAAAVAASDDVLNVEVAAPTTTTFLAVNGFETVNLAFDTTATDYIGLALEAHDSKGTTQTINLSGGDKAESVGLHFDNEGSAKLTDLTIDGSALATGLGAITLDGQALNIKNVTIKGSATEENVFAHLTVDDTQNLTVIGGNEDDTFTAVAAIETFTGGKGNDTFKFTVETASVTMTAGDKAVIDGVDTITDFKKGDSLQLDIISKLNLVKAVTGEAASLNSLDKWVAKAADEGLVGGAAAFNFGGDAYILLAEADATVETNASLIKLAGVNVDSFFEAGKDTADATTAGFFSFA